MPPCQQGSKSIINNFTFTFGECRWEQQNERSDLCGIGYLGGAALLLVPIAS
jgi:hypothetical protein